MGITRLRADTGFESEYDNDRAVADYLTWLRAGHERRPDRADGQAGGSGAVNR